MRTNKSWSLRKTKKKERKEREKREREKKNYLSFKTPKELEHLQNNNKKEAVHALKEDIMIMTRQNKPEKNPKEVKKMI